LLLFAVVIDFRSTGTPPEAFPVAQRHLTASSADRDIAVSHCYPAQDIPADGRMTNGIAHATMIEVHLPVTTVLSGTVA
jgi:hypothetical protein